MNDNKVYCPRCGSEMNSNSRYCMKCGYLNPNDPQNQNMTQYIPDTNTNSYQIGSGQVINQDNKNVTMAIASNTGNTIFCFVLNFLIYIAILVFGFIYSMRGLEINLINIKLSIFPYVACVSSIVFLFIYSLQLIFIKCNKKWWSVFIPVYNLMILAEITFKKKWIGLLTLIPIVGQILFLVMLYKLGTKFKYNGLLTMIFSLIYIPIIGFGTRLYENTTFVSNNDSLEKDYKRKKVFLTLIVLFIGLGLAFIFWNNIIETKNKAKKLTNYYFVMANHRLIDKTKQLVRENYLECDDYEYSNNTGIYYIYYPDIHEHTYLPFYYLRDAISASVIIDNSYADTKYYVSMSDGTYGFGETLSTDVNINTVVEYKEVIRKQSSEINYCIITKPKITVGEM